MDQSTSKPFARTSTWLSKWLGCHWALIAAGVLVIIGLASAGVDDTNVAIGVTLLMVFVLQNSQNRDSAS